MAENGFSSTAQAWVGTPRAFCPRTNGVVPAKTTKKLAVSPQKKQRCNQGKTWKIPWFWGLPRNVDIASHSKSKVKDTRLNLLISSWDMTQKIHYQNLSLETRLREIQRNLDPLKGTVDGSDFCC